MVFLSYLVPPKVPPRCPRHQMKLLQAIVRAYRLKFVSSQTPSDQSPSIDMPIQRKNKPMRKILMITGTLYFQGGTMLARPNPTIRLWEATNLSARGAGPNGSLGLYPDLISRANASRPSCDGQVKTDSE
jgi:hypothetical protein